MNTDTRKIERPTVTIITDGNNKFTYTVHCYNDLYTRTVSGVDADAVQGAADRFITEFDKQATAIESDEVAPYYIMTQFVDNKFFTKGKALRSTVDVTGI